MRNKDNLAKIKKAQSIKKLSTIKIIPCLSIYLGIFFNFEDKELQKHPRKKNEEAEEEGKEGRKGGEEKKHERKKF